MPQNDTVLELQHVSNWYAVRGKHLLSPQKFRKVLNDVSFAVGQGETFGIVGESGCGKSTLAKAVVGLMKTDGTILLDGERVSAHRTKSQRKKVQIVFQDPLSSLNPTKTIGWILEEPLRIHRLGNRKERAARVEEVLKQVGLSASYRNRYPAQLSGGQRQRVSIAAALMLRPKLVVADEPVSALDVSIQSQILNLLRDLKKSLQLSFLFISHNLNVVYYLCDRVAVMYLGQIVELANVEDLYKTPLHPYTQMLLASVPELDGEPADTITAVKGEASMDAAEGGGCPFYSRCSIAKPACREKVPALQELRPDLPHGHLVRCHLAQARPAALHTVSAAGKR